MSKELYLEVRTESYYEYMLDYLIKVAQMREANEINSSGAKILFQEFMNKPQSRAWFGKNDAWKKWVDAEYQIFGGFWEKIQEGIEEEERLGITEKPLDQEARKAAKEGRFSEWARSVSSATLDIDDSTKHSGQTVAHLLAKQLRSL